jgi:hypothetical protein
VQIANLVMPSEEERAERRAVHERLDAICRRLKHRASKDRRAPGANYRKGFPFR